MYLKSSQHCSLVRSFRFEDTAYFPALSPRGGQVVSVISPLVLQLEGTAVITLMTGPPQRLDERYEWSLNDSVNLRRNSTSQICA